MERVFFSSCKPYTQIFIDRNKSIVFNAEGKYFPKDEEELQSLRMYERLNKGSYVIAEGVDPAELMRMYEELEIKRIREAEDKHKADLEAEERRKEDHNFYSLLRMSDKAYR